MRVLNDFECTTCGHQQEYFLDNETLETECQKCQGVAKKKRSVPNFQLPGNDPHGFPTAYDKWEKKREQKMALERKQGMTPAGQD